MARTKTPHHITTFVTRVVPRVLPPNAFVVHCSTRLMVKWKCHSQHLALDVLDSVDGSEIPRPTTWDGAKTRRK